MPIYLSVSEKARQEMVERAAEGGDMLRRIDMLTGVERVMMTMYFEKGSSFEQIARLANLSAATVSRRIHKISSRLTDGRYLRCLRNKEMFTKFELAIAKEHFVRGKSIRALTKEKGATYHKMRRTVKRIESVLELVKKRDRRGRNQESWSSRAARGPER